MTRYPNVAYFMIFALGVSLFSLFILLMLASHPPAIYESFLWQKPMVGLIFSLICVLGMFAAVFPSKCSGDNHLRRRDEKISSDTVTITLVGHHLDCSEFSSHVIDIHNRKLCAACTGLFIGASISLIGAIIYYFFGWNIGGSGLTMVYVGTVGVILGFLQLRFRGFCRLALNILFVLGAFLILTGMDVRTQSLLIDLFVLFLVVFWIWTRIILSRWDHWRICTECKLKCKYK